MRIVVASNDDAMVSYLQEAGYHVKPMYNNDLINKIIQEYPIDAVVYFSNADFIKPHEEAIRYLLERGTRIILVVEPDNPLLVYAAILGITDILIYPVEPETLIYRLHNPATALETAELVRSCNERLMAINKEADTGKTKTETFLKRLVKKKETPSSSRVKHSSETNKTRNNSDSLTGCLLRSELETFLHKQDGIYTVLFCDLDNFKLINDTYGHAAGDEIIRSFGEFLLQSTRQSDRVFRYGGDEFVVALPNTEIKGASVLTERMCNSWNRRIFSCIENRNVLFSGKSSSIGMSGFEQGIK